MFMLLRWSWCIPQVPAVSHGVQKFSITAPGEELRADIQLPLEVLEIQQPAHAELPTGNQHVVDNHQPVLTEELRTKGAVSVDGGDYLFSAMSRDRHEYLVRQQKPHKFHPVLSFLMWRILHTTFKHDIPLIIGVAQAAMLPMHVSRLNVKNLYDQHAPWIPCYYSNGFEIWLRNF